MQIFLTLRLDDDIDWSYAAVGTPLLIWMGLQLFGHVYEVNEMMDAMYPFEWSGSLG